MRKPKITTKSPKSPKNARIKANGNKKEKKKQEEKPK